MAGAKRKWEKTVGRRQNPQQFYAVCDHGLNPELE